MEITELAALKNKRKICAVTAYDYTTAKIVSECGIDLILVGDSLSQCFQGNSTTLPVTVNEMIYHTKAVCRGAQSTLVTADLPFMSYQVSAPEGLRNAGKIMKKTGCQSVKLEGGCSRRIELISACVEAGIPVVGHIGLTPQSVNVFGGYHVQGKKSADEERIFREALEIEKSGAFCLVLECIPYQLARNITLSLKIPTVGIGAGPYCDGQILVINDLLGLTNWEKKPRFVKCFASMREEMKNALQSYQSEVSKGIFPDLNHSYRGGNDENHQPS